MNYLQPLDSMKNVLIIQFSQELWLKTGDDQRGDSKHDFKGSEPHLVRGIPYPKEAKGEEGHPVCAGLYGQFS